MASNIDNCCKCLNTIKGDSICCSTCNKWYHLKCSNLERDVFKQHLKNDKLIWNCVKCVLYKCGKCYKIIKSHQSCIECDCCKKWIHLRCSGLDINTFKILGNSNQPWFCMSCTQDNLPFFSLDQKKLAKLFFNKEKKKLK